MEYRTVSTKLPITELTLFRAHCKKKGLTPAKLIRSLILDEMNITIPHEIAGRNKISYDKYKDLFVWSIELDNDKKIEVLKNISPTFIENLNQNIGLAMAEREAFIRKKKPDSVPIPSKFLRSLKE